MKLGGAQPPEPPPARFYHKDGTLCREITGANGKPRSPRVSDMKKHCLVPRTSTVLQEFAADTEYYVAKRGAEAMFEHLLHNGTSQDLDATKESLIEQAAMESLRSQTNAAEFGTAFHKSAETGEWPASTVAWRPFFEQFMQEHVAETIYNERTLVGDFWGGTVDRVVRTTAGKVAVLDWKTQSYTQKPTFYRKWALQVASYEPLLDVAVDEWWSVVVPSRAAGPFVLKVWPDTKTWVQQWWAAVSYWRIRYGV